METAEPKCVICGSGFKKKAGQQVTCGPECSRVRKNRRANERTAIYRVAIECECRGCGKPFQPKARDRMTYCSRKCAYDHKSAISKDRVTAPTKRQGKRKWAKWESLAISSGAMAWMKQFGQCSGCGDQGPLWSTLYCSGRCKALARRLYEAAIPRLAISCTECGVQFENVAKTAKRCPECQQKRRNHNGDHYARAGRMGVAREVIDPLLVFARDNYICQICSEQTDPAQKAPHPNSPTLDHIIPMSKGGPHTMDNVQCACWTCNCVVKNDRLPWELDATQGILCDMVASCT